MDKNLGKKSKIGFLWDISGSLLRQIITLGISIILARLLGPKEFGLIAMSMVFINISNVFTDVGFTSGLIQQQNTKDIAYSSVFYVNLVLSVILSIVVIITAPTIANFYSEPRIEILLILLSIIPPIAAIGKVHATILTKKLNFKLLTIKDLAINTIGGLLAILIAYLGYGVYSLIVQQIIYVLLGSIFLWYFSGWKPKFEFSYDEIKKVFNYSGFVFLDSLFRQIFNQIDIIFIAKIFSPTILGFYSRAASLRAQIQTYTTNSLSKVLFPSLSRLQDDNISFEAAYFKVYNILSGLIILLIAPVFFLSEFIIINLLGEQWRPTVLIFEILVLTVLVSPHIKIMADAVLAKGLSNLRFYMGLAQRFLMLLPLIIGYYFSIKEFSIAMVISAFLNFIFNALILSYRLKFDLWKQINYILLPNSVFIVFLLIKLLLPFEVNNFLIVMLFIVSHILFLFVIKHPSFVFVENNLKKIINSK